MAQILKILLNLWVNLFINSFYPFTNIFIMKEIKCPHCKQVFSVDESAFESIALQVRDSLFHDELERREQELRKSVEAEFKMQQALSDKQA